MTFQTSRSLFAVSKAGSFQTSQSGLLVPPQLTDAVAYTAGAVHFDAATWAKRLTLTSTDNKKAASSIWLKSPAVFGVPWGSDPENQYDNIISFDGAGNLNVFAGQGANWVSVIVPVPANTWFHCFTDADFSDLTNPLIVYVGDTLYTTIANTAGDPSSVTALDFNGKSLWVGSDSFGGDEYTADMADLWVAPGVSLRSGSASIPTATRRKFIDGSGKPVYLGANGEVPTGSAPAVFLSGDASSFGTNLGTGGTLTTTGTLTNANTSPSS